MKKIILASLVLGVMLATAGIVVAAGTGKAGDENSRYLVKSNNSVLKMMYGVRHNFDSGFTTNLTQGQLKVLEKFGVETEEVVMYHILVPPGACSPWPECRNEEPEPEPEPCKPSVRKPWGIERVNGGSGGAGVNVAVLDSGVYKEHLDLDVKLCKDATKRRIKDGCLDVDGHGTHVAGTIAANGGSDGEGIFGVAPEANLWVIKVCGPTGCWTDDIAAGIRYATDNGANIISMSLGGSVESSLIREAIDHAIEGDVLVIAAAGNYHPIYNPENVIQYPAANPDVVAVAAFDELDNIADFSSRGLNDNDWMIEEREIEFAAPGVEIESTWNDGCYNTISGTSMATPHIAGIAARDWKIGGAIETRTYLQGLAEQYTEDTINGYDYGLTGDDIEAGFGLPIVVQSN